MPQESQAEKVVILGENEGQWVIVKMSHIDCISMIEAKTYITHSSPLIVTKPNFVVSCIHTLSNYFLGRLYIHATLV